MPRVAASQREEFQEERRQAILEATLRLVASRGFESVTMAAIAAEAGLTKGTLYLYFPSKQALLDALLHRYSLGPALQDLTRDAAALPLEEAVRALVGLAWRRLHEARDVVALAIRELPGHPDASRRLLEQVILPTNRILAAFLDAKLAPERRGRIHSLVAARSLLGMVLSMFLSQELLGGRELVPLDDDVVTSTIVELFLHGVSGPR